VRLEQSRSLPGSGLGLSLVHRIIADHNGTVEAHSRPGEGTRFAVCLPLPRDQSEIPT
jgi:signal transduction histidine kinase